MPTLTAIALGLALLGAAPASKATKEKPMSDKQELVFEKANGERFAALRSWMEQRASGWRHVPRHQAGNFVQERWCPMSVDEQRCSSGSVVAHESRGTAWLSLETLHYPKDWPKVFGLLVGIGYFPAKGDLGLRFYLAEDGRTVVGDGMDATFLSLEGERVSGAVSLGARTELEVGGQTVSVTGAGGWRAALKRMAASPESLAAFQAEQLDALARRVEEALTRGEVKGFDEGEYKGDGVPPEKTPRPLTAAELAAVRKAAGEELARRRAFTTRHARAMHALLVEQVPVKLLE